jgi:DNA-binding MarR family transcriptional regulator
MPAEVRQVLDAIRRIVRVLRLSSRAAEERAGVSAAQLFVLQALAEADQVSLNELAARTFTDQSSVSVVVARLVERGLVRRRRSVADARRLELRLSAKGRAVLQRAPAAPQDQLVAGLRRLSASELAVLAGALSRFVAAIGVDRSPADMLFEDEARWAGAPRHGRSTMRRAGRVTRGGRVPGRR